MPRMFRCPPPACVAFRGRSAMTGRYPLDGEGKLPLLRSGQGTQGRSSGLIARLPLPSGGCRSRPLLAAPSPRETFEFPGDDGVALAGGGFVAGPVLDGDPPAAVGDQPGFL